MKVYRVKRITEKIQCSRVEDIPPLHVLKQLPAEKRLRLVFDKCPKKERRRIADTLRPNLHGYIVAAHVVKPWIDVYKIISDEDIDRYQDFFEQCAKDFRALARTLVHDLVRHLKLNIYEPFPWKTFEELENDRSRRKGTINDWTYRLVVGRCDFVNTKTKQNIIVDLSYGLEFGTLHAFEFMLFIKTSKKYLPLPIAIYNNHVDGRHIIHKMIGLGKFEVICSSLGNASAAVVTDRDKVTINVYEPDLPAVLEKEFIFWRSLMSDN